MKKIIENLKSNKKMFIITLSLLAVVGVSLAYLIPQLMDGANTNANLVIDTVDNLNFSVNNDITLRINQQTLAEGGNDVSEEAIGTARLLANSTNNSASYNYYVYLDIIANEFIYTTTDNKPEIVLTVKDPNGQLVTSLNDLTYNSALQGFDITTETGIITIANQQTIASSSSTTPTIQNWTFTVKFINLNTNQKENASKKLNAKIIIQKDEYTFAQHIKSSYVSNGTDQTLLYHDSTLTNGAGDNSYRYSGANPNNFVCFGTNATTCPNDNLYRIIGIFDNGTGKYSAKLIKYDYATSTQLGTTGDYSTNTFLAAEYPSYKGNQTTINRYYWNYSNGTSSTNTWSTSRLNTVNLNTNYINYLTSAWSSKIVETTWQVGGNSISNIREVTQNEVYINEITSPASSIKYNSKIGLMYVSDYGFAANPDSWTIYLLNYNNATVTQNNWMYMGLYEWTITRNTTNTFVVDRTGYISYGDVHVTYAIRPVFYLNTDVQLVSGLGTQTDPYRI